MRQNNRNPTLVAAAALLLGAVACTAKTDDAAVVGDTGSAVVSADVPAVVPAMPAPADPAATAGAWINPNSAAAAQLLTVPGMTQPIADALIAGRPYTNMIGVNTVLVKTLSEQQRDSVYTRVWMPIDLNKATGEEMQLIPGFGPRMEREFKEYRPYTDIARFRREIGKYVNATELARLEKYVELR